MKVLLLILLAVLLLAQQAPPPVNFPQVNRKARALTPDELATLKRLNDEFELLARRACDSIGVPFQDCSIEGGQVQERQKPPVVPQGQVPARPPEAKPETKPEAPKPPAK